MTKTKSKPPLPQLAPMSVARMLWKHKLLVLFGWILLAGFGCYVVMQLPAVYRAEALVLVDSQKIPERFVASTVQVTPQDQVATINQQVLSSGRLEKVIQEFDLYRNERKTASREEILTRMRRDATITPDKARNGIRPSAFRISYECPNPTVAARVANRIAGLFIDESFKTREERAQGTSEFLDSQLQEARKNLELQERILREFKTKRMGELPEQEGALMAMMMRFQSELQTNQEALNRAEQNKIMLENALRIAESAQAGLQRNLEQERGKPAAVSTMAPGQTGRKTRSSDELRTQLATLRLRYSEDHPDVKRQEKALALALQQEAQTEDASAAHIDTPASSTAPPGKTDSPQIVIELNRERERISTTKSQIASAEKEIQSRNSERQRILSQISEYQAKVERLPVREQELASITRDYEISRQNYKSLLDKKMSAEMATEMERRQQSERFTLLDPATVPAKPVRPNRPFLSGAASTLGFLLAMGLAFAIEFPRNRFLGEWELGSDLKVIGCISEVRIARAARAKESNGPRTAAPLASTGEVH